MTGPSDDRKPSVQRAKVQYAKFHNVSVGDVTQEMLVESPEGLEGWACYGLDCKARGPMGNAMYRQLKKDPGAQECYKWLFDDLKKSSGSHGPWTGLSTQCPKRGSRPSARR